MRVLIVGAGAIGILLGARLERAGHEVSLVGRRDTVEAAASSGLVTIEPDGQRRLKARVFDGTDLSEISDTPPEAIVLAVKAYDTGPAMERLLPLAGRGVPVLVVQNGVGGEEDGLALMPDEQWYGAVTTIVGERLAPGVVRQSRRKAALAIAPLSNTNDSSFMVSLFASTGFDEVRACSDHAAMKWSKLLLNILGNAIPAILNWAPEEAMRDGRLFPLERAAYREALAVMGALSIRPISLPGYPIPFHAQAISLLPAFLLRPILAQQLSAGRGGKRPSLHIDLVHRKGKSEVAYLNGAVVRFGRQMGIPTPVNRMITDTLLALISGAEDPGEYRGRPEALVARVRCAAQGDEG